MHCDSRYPFSLTCKKPCAQERVPKGGQAPESFYWKDTNASAGAASNLTSRSTADLGHDAAHQSPRPDPTEHQEASP
jgi:hypothetical protein